MSQSESTEFVRILEVLNHAQCDFVIIGGLALILHGGDYLTYDADFSFARDRANSEKFAMALQPFRPRPVDWPVDLPFVWDAQTVRNSTTLTLRTELGRIDLLAEPDGAPPYASLKERAVVFDVEGLIVKAACIEDLIAMKKAAGRPKDLGHIAELETLRRLDEGGTSGSN